MAGDSTWWNTSIVVTWFARYDPDHQSRVVVVFLLFNREGVKTTNSGHRLSVVHLCISAVLC